MQQAQLFGHLSVVQNVEFGLRVRRVDRGRRRRRAVDLLELVGLAHLQDRSPLHLSGGEQQRVALARALAVDPEVLLADEPLASLDPEVRRSLQELLGQVRRDLGTTVLLVTHDVGEALALADQLVVLAGGQIHAHGAPRAVLAQPQTETAARLLGLRNVIRGVRGGDALHTSFGRLATSPVRSAGTSSAAVGGQVVVVIDPRRVRVVDRPGPNRVAGTIVDMRLLGVDVEATVAVDGAELISVVRAGDATVGAAVHLELPACHLVEVSAAPQPP
jgi:putative spermidine/putrescine transport system ATP-binding protein